MPRKPNGKKAGRPSFKPSPEDRQAVEAMAACGINQADISRVIGGGIDEKTLRQHFREELDTAAIRANAKIGGTAYEKACDGDHQMIRYWLNCRAGWREKTETDVNLSGEIITRIETVVVDPKN